MLEGSRGGRRRRELLRQLMRLVHRDLQQVDRADELAIEMNKPVEGDLYSVRRSRGVRWRRFLAVGAEEGVLGLAGGRRAWRLENEQGSIYVRCVRLDATAGG